jgi:hypothetical protein
MLQDSRALTPLRNPDNSGFADTTMQVLLRPGTIGGTGATEFDLHRAGERKLRGRGSPASCSKLLPQNNSFEGSIPSPE